VKPERPARPDKPVESEDAGEKTPPVESDEEEYAQILEVMQATASPTATATDEVFDGGASKDLPPPEETLPMPPRPARLALQTEKPGASVSALTEADRIKVEEHKDEQLVSETVSLGSGPAYSPEHLRKMQQEDEEEVAARGDEKNSAIKMASRALNEWAHAEHGSTDDDVAKAQSLSVSAAMLQEAATHSGAQHPQFASALQTKSSQATSRANSILDGSQSAVVGVSLASTSMNAFATAVAAEADGSPAAGGLYSMAAQ